MASTENAHAGDARRSAEWRAVRRAAGARRRRRDARGPLRARLCAIARTGDGKCPACKSARTRAWPWSPIRCTPRTTGGCRARRAARRQPCAARRRRRLTSSPGLPYSALEASAVAKAFGSSGTIQLIGLRRHGANACCSCRRSDLAVLHFATHAVARQDSPEQSALYLSEYTPDGALLPDSRTHRRTTSRAAGCAPTWWCCRVAPPATAARCAAKACSASPTDFSPTVRTRSSRRCGRSKTPRPRAS